MSYPLHTLLHRTAHSQQNYLRPYLRRLGLSPGQPKVLRSLELLGVCSQRELAELCGVDPAAISRTLERMERAGLLTREASASDRRTGQVRLTEQGHRAFRAWEAECAALEERMFSGFSPAERAQLAGYLTRAWHNMGDRLPEDLAGREKR